MLDQLWIALRYNPSPIWLTRIHTGCFSILRHSILPNKNLMDILPLFLSLVNRSQNVPALCHHIYRIKKWIVQCQQTSEIYYINYSRVQQIIASSPSMTLPDSWRKVDLTHWTTCSLGESEVLIMSCDHAFWPIVRHLICIFFYKFILM